MVIFKIQYNKWIIGELTSCGKVYLLATKLISMKSIKGFSDQLVHIGTSWQSISDWEWSDRTTADAPKSGEMHMDVFLVLHLPESMHIKSVAFPWTSILSNFSHWIQNVYFSIVCESLKIPLLCWKIFPNISFIRLYYTFLEHPNSENISSSSI